MHDDVSIMWYVDMTASPGTLVVNRLKLEPFLSFFLPFFLLLAQNGLAKELVLL